jgi:hypothetical protein
MNLTEWLDPFLANLLTALAVLAGSMVLGGWMAWRRHRDQARRAAQSPSRNEDTEST